MTVSVDPHAITAAFIVAAVVLLLLVDPPRWK